MGISEYIIILYPDPESQRNGTTEPVAFMTVQTEESLVETSSATAEIARVGKKLQLYRKSPRVTP